MTEPMVILAHHGWCQAVVIKNPQYVTLHLGILASIEKELNQHIQ